MDNPAGDQVYCSEISIKAAEPLPGTATPTTVFILLEYNGAWGEKALDESDVPAALKSRLKTYGKANSQAKILLIRSTRSLIQPGYRFFIVRCTDEARLVYDFHVSDYEELLDVDIDAVLAGDAAFADARRDTSLILVCTNGRRDRCCARYGAGVYAALSELSLQSPEVEVWQCSHIGGHRFAANVISLPSGMLFGRVRADDAPELFAAVMEGRILVDNLRGRLAYPPAAQAAEVALRQALNEERLAALWMTGIEQAAPLDWRMEFVTETGKTYRIDAHIEKTEREVYESCTLDKTTSIPAYTFDIREVGV